MAVAVTRTIASRGFRIAGSGTESTRMSLGPCQHTALMIGYSRRRRRPPFVRVGIPRLWRRSPRGIALQHGLAPKPGTRGADGRLHFLLLLRRRKDRRHAE